MGKWSLERRREHAEKMRTWHERLSDEERAVRAEKIRLSCSGKKRSAEQRARISESQKGKVLSEEHRKKVSSSLKRAYTEGEREPVRSNHRRGAVLSELTRARISKARSGIRAWNKGISTGPRSPETKEKISISQKERPFSIPSEKRPAWREKNSLSHMGKKASTETRKKMSESQRKSWASGDRYMPPSSGYGKGSYFETPFQGQCWLRSTSEVRRARELDAQGVSWLYEAQRFPLEVNGKSTTYCPDFWILPGFQGDIEDVSEFLDSYSGLILIEDVKGWWGPTHKTYDKIQAFSSTYLHLSFEIVLRGSLP